MVMGGTFNHYVLPPKMAKTYYVQLGSQFLNAILLNKIKIKLHVFCYILYNIYDIYDTDLKVFHQRVNDGR